jgi:23S rRNA (guanosine2251-2'-O)-methyltransferase
MDPMGPPGIGELVEGHHAVAAAIAAGRVRRLTVEKNRVTALADLLDRAESAGVTVEVVDDVRPLATTTAPQGVVARCRPIPEAEMGAAVQRVDPPAVIVLDRVEDPRNLGAIARSALAAGMGGLVVGRRRAAPLSATAFKAAAGALEQLPVVVVSSIAGAIDDLRRRGLWIVGLAADGEDSIYDVGVLTEPVAVVLGSEGKGMSRLAGQRADVIARFPLAGGVESLNVSVAAALAAFEVSRRRGTA